MPNLDCDRRHKSRTPNRHGLITACSNADHKIYGNLGLILHRSADKIFVAWLELGEM